MVYDAALRQWAVELVGEGASLSEAAQSAGVSHETVRKWALAAGVYTPGGRASFRTLPKDVWEWVVDRAVVLAEQGASTSELVAAFGVPRAGLQRRLLARGVKVSRRHVRPINRVSCVQELWQDRKYEAFYLFERNVAVDEVVTRMDLPRSVVVEWHTEFMQTVLHRGCRGGAVSLEDYLPSALEEDGPNKKVGRGRRLSKSDRVFIEEQLRAGHSARSIAVALGRNPSVITREINRNCDKEGHYLWARADTVTKLRFNRPKIRKLDSNRELRREVVARLVKHHSPEEIAHRLVIDFPDNEDMRISHETIYQALYIRGVGTLRSELKVEQALRTGRNKRKPRSKLPSRQGRRTWVEGANIKDRPAEANDRVIPGHWEGDLIIGGNGTSATITLVERTTRFLLLGRLGSEHTSPTTVKKLESMVADLPRLFTKTITWDQGSEMAASKSLELSTDFTLYFCDPHSPWQRGTNENTNGLLRQYWPKGFNFDTITDEDVELVQDELNDRPRKALGYYTPREVFGNLLAKQNDAITG